MCMIAACVTKDFGVLAADSAQYIADVGDISFEVGKVAKIGKYLVTFIGTPLYFVNLDKAKFSLPLDQLSFYLSTFFKSERPGIEEAMKEGIKDEEENSPHLCVYVMGLYAKRPTLAQFNSFLDFKPKYIWTDDSDLKFATIIYGDDSNPDKQSMFKESSKFMEDLAKKWFDKPEVESPHKFATLVVSPGLVAEILARGIYKKADLEMEIGYKKKYAGGMVHAAAVKRDGLIYSLSTVEVLNGGI